MNQFARRTLLMIAVFTAAGATAGTRDGGGGVGVRCGKALEILDMHEGLRRGLKFSQAPQTETAAIELVARRLVTHHWNPATIPVDKLVEIISKDLVGKIFRGEPVTMVDTGDVHRIEYVNDLPLSKDIGRYDIAPGCHLEQIAYWDDVQKVLRVSEPRLKELDFLGRSILFGHEIQYLIDRKDGLEELFAPQTSERVRTFVARLFSDSGLTPRGAGIPTKFKICDDADYDNGNYFWIYDSAPNEVTAVFSILGHRSSMYQMKATWPGVTIADLNDDGPGQGVGASRLQFVDEGDAPEVNVAFTKRPGEYPQFSVTHENGRVITSGSIRCTDN